MLTPIANVHHSKLPSPGAIVTVRLHPIHPEYRYRRFIVESFPLRDGVFSIGIHTVNLRALDNGQRVRVAGHYCMED